MSAWQRHAITIACLVAAVVCYMVGYMPGFTTVFLLGACFETVFWIRVLNARYKRQRRLEALGPGDDTSQEG